MSLFKEKVYKIVRKIPKGRVATYKAIAVSIGSPRAYRGVAKALSKNFNKDIPCHRVVRSDGFIGGYNRGGYKQKEKFLCVEGVFVKGNRVDLNQFSCFYKKVNDSSLTTSDNPNRGG